LINKIIREDDVIDVERQQVKIKFLSTDKLIDIEARAIFTIGTCMRVLIKCCHEFNHYRNRDSQINNDNSMKECPCYSKEKN